MDRVVVQGANKATKHVKPSRGSAGGIEEREAPVHISNVMHADPKDGKPTRVGRSEEHTSELQSLMSISYAVFCLKKKTRKQARNDYLHYHTIISDTSTPVTRYNDH